ncbi:ROK family protein [Bifidobacterium psychraerophilum]|jgi:predicted NBD/HSP70 family sugar kinase|uniref:ROK family protein n=1 Tax=Bifidobacterium psychraerophilum TaxID=218140 RepID=UPI0023EFD7F9|nr:ROK family protein [Bifidobacterium psychraerophilum]MCI1660925.1 ROK family protein [Bifidobacterium psychraerophilum]MCI1804411.1 ROK family protein [Bifidobacterium psychraerophilum]MCI2177432.1 ROK family protein [Bifidobacterium psychraerophilum]MCI2182754.1 ROK family protein [Bifidobacterium psychraerophilum]
MTTSSDLDPLNGIPVDSSSTKQKAESAPIPQWFDASPYTHQVAADIVRYGPIARTTLAQILKLSQGALSRITGDLLHLGVIEELPDARLAQDAGRLPFGFSQKQSESSEKRGRPLTALRINKDERSFIGINVRGNSALAVAVNALCEPLGEPHTLAFTYQSPEELAVSLAKVVAECVKDAKRAALPEPSLLGLSLGGHIVDNATVTAAPFLHWNGNANLAELLTRRCGIPTLVFNDLESALRHECWFGVGVGVSRFALITIGAGIGYSIAQDGEPLSGSETSYGTATHIIVDPEGPRCYQGHIGCADSLTNDSIAEQYSEMMSKTCSFEDFVTDARKGLRQATQLLNRTCFRLGVLIATIANAAMPQKVLIGGESSFLAEMSMESLRKGVETYRHSQAAPVPIEILDDTWINWGRSAASSAIERYILG